MSLGEHGPVSAINNFLRRRPKGLLHHYTTSGGLIGIFQSQTLWATSIQHLNDSEEYIHALKLLQQELEARLDCEIGEKQQMFSEWLDNLKTEEAGGTFVVSFSEQSDLLSQWRAYATCDNAYSIGFNNEELSQAIKLSDCRLVRCVYALDEQKVLINHLADYLYKCWVRLQHLEGERWWAWIGRSNSVATSVLAAIKHPSFSEEKEWRIVTWADSKRQMHFRAGRFGIVPFYKLPLAISETSKLRFSEVMIGPTQNREAAMYAADQLISDYGVPWKVAFNKLIHHSNSSLRP